MEIVFHFKSENFAKAKEILLTDDIVGRASMTFKDGTTVGKDGYFCYFSGTDEQCKRAKDLIKDLAEISDDKTKILVISKIKEEEDQAIQGFGSILG